MPVGCGRAGAAVPSSGPRENRGIRSRRLATVDKVAQRRSELAAAALKTLAEQGYARTGLREIAANSEFSHGVLHYYFRDKVDLITHCVRRVQGAVRDPLRRGGRDRGVRRPSSPRASSTS